MSISVESGVKGRHRLRVVVNGARSLMDVLEDGMLLSQSRILVVDILRV